MVIISQFGNWLYQYQIWLARQRGPVRAFIVIVLGALAATSQAPYYFVPGFIIAFTSLIWLLDAARHRDNSRRALRWVAFWTTWFFAFGYLLHSLYWLAFSFAVHGQGEVMKGALWVVGFLGTALLCAFIACFYGSAIAVAIRWWPDQLKEHSRLRGACARLALFIIAWSLAEYARGHLFTGLPWNLTGQIFAGHILTAQSTALLGPYGIGVIALGLAVVPANILLQRRIAIWSCMIGVLLVVLVFGYGVLRLVLVPEPGVNPAIWMRIVQPNIVQTDKIDPEKYAANFSKALSLSVSAPIAQKNDAVLPPEKVVIIWPENASYNFFQSSTEAIKAISHALPGNTTLLSGAVRWTQDQGEPRQFYNTMLVMARQTGVAGVSVPPPKSPDQITHGDFVIADHFDKYHLAPFGEYLPFSNFIQALGLDDIIPFGADFKAGQGPRTLTVSGTKVAPLICYETIFPGRTYSKSALKGTGGANDRPEWLVTVTNDAWFGDSAGPLQHLAQSRLRSIETGLPMLRAANTGVSAVIDAKGRFISRLPLYVQGVLDTPLPKPIAIPLYSRWGDTLYWLILALMSGGLAWGHLIKPKVD